MALGKNNKSDRMVYNVFMFTESSLELCQAWNSHWGKRSEELHKESPVIVQLRSCELTNISGLDLQTIRTNVEAIGKN